MGLDEALDRANASYKRGDYAEALEGFSDLAEKGDAEAQNNLGVMYSYGDGVPKDYAEAVKWYRMAAEQGYADAQANLGFAYLTGYGLPKDYVQAYMWSKLAGARGNKMARRNRDIAAKRITRALIIKASRMAREWKPKE